uniref:Uncharacterized protein n=1 Tax=Tanacetum cinerariifolium TaxID=118510 RepID=A0A699IK15_TANCI|nr:hypothetical protein [Tanacetum cinerariifolium]
MKRKVGNEDLDVRQIRNTKYFESLKTPPIKRKVGRPKKSVRANEIKSSSVKRRGHPRKRNDEEKKKTIGSKERSVYMKMGFRSMIGMGIHELSGKLGLLRFPDYVKLNELNKKFQEDLCNKDLARNEDVEDANVTNPSEAANVARTSPNAQAKFKNIHYDLRCLKEELYEGLLRFPDCVKLNELNKKFQEDLCNKDLARNEDANVANPSEAANVARTSPTVQGSHAAILHASPIRMTKKTAKRTG